MQGLDWLLRLATPRNLVLALLAAGAINLGTHRSDVWRRWYRERFYPPQAQPVDPDLALEMRKGEALRVQTLYHKVSALIEEARGSGFAVDGLQAKANAALDLEKAGFREPALQVLGDVEMQIPRQKVQYIPMEAQEATSDLESPDLLPSQLPKKAAAAQPAKAKKKKKASKHRRRRRKADDE